MIQTNQELYFKLCQQHFVIAGPCVLESFDLALQVAKELKRCSEQTGIQAIFKASFDKANRTSVNSFRGPGMEKGLECLQEIKALTNLPIITDIHESSEAEKVAQVADVLQIPAFLCRQTSLLEAASRTGKIINIKKGQFLAPWDVKNIVEKCYHFSNRSIMITERGTSFGYNNLVVDMRSFPILNALQIPTIIDATHSVQLPGGEGSSSGGDRKFIAPIAMASVAAGAKGVFLECHPEPEKALCDGPNSLHLHDLEAFLKHLVSLWELSDVFYAQISN